MRARSWLLVALAVSLPLSAARWVARGPAGDGVRAMASLGPTLFVGTEGHGIFRSGDDGRSWTNVSDPRLASTAVFSMVADPAGVVYASTNAGIFATRNRGATWTDISNSYADIAGGLAIDGSTLYAFGRPFTLVRTRDGGATWESIANGLNQNNDWVTGVAVHGTTLVAAEFGGLYRSGDDGESWQRVLAIPSFRVTALGDGTFVALTIDAGLMRSTDDGRTWTDANGSLPLPLAAWNVYAGPGTRAFVLSGNMGVAQSDDGARSWTTMNDGLPSDRPSVLTTIGNTIFVGGSAVYRRNTGDRMWSRAASLPGFGHIYDVGANDAAVWAIDDLEIFSSDDGGSTWTPHGVGSTSSTIAADPTNASVAYYGTARVYGAPIFFHATIARTDDKGATWSVLWTGDVGVGVQKIAIDPRTGVVYAGLNNGLMVSSDRGATWTTTLPGENVVAFAFDATSSYAATMTGAWVSRDSGRTWTRTLSANVNAIAATSSMVWAATATGLAWSVDHGASWTLQPSTAPVTALVASPSGRVFAAAGGDVFEMSPTTSRRVDDAAAGSTILSLVYRDDTLIAGTTANGVMTLSLSPRTHAVRR